MESTDGEKIWVKWPKTSWKLQLAFLGQNSGGQADFLVNGRDPLSPPPCTRSDGKLCSDTEFRKATSTADFKVDSVKIILRKSC